jgi:hypothetical protein
VLERIDSGEADVGVGEQIELGIEPVVDRLADRREGLAALVATELLEVSERIDDGHRG